MPKVDAAAVLASRYRARLLPPDEWDARQAELPYPPGVLDPSEYKRLVVVEDGEGRIVGSWCAMNLVALEGLHLDEAHQHGVAAKHLLYGMLDTLMKMGTPAAMALIADPAVQALAEKVGFVALPGVAYQITLPQEGT